MKNIRTRLITLSALFGVLATANLSAQNTRDNPRSGVDFYLQSYGRVPDSELVDVYAVFEKVRRASDKSSLVSPQLIVVADDRQASAFALSDGTIFLSKKALAIIREGASADQVASRLAFVLGHELAHLANNDFWDNQISQALLESATAREVSAKRQGQDVVVDTTAGQQIKELKADDLGFVFAALAGYDVDSLLHPTNANADFFSFWNAKAGKRNDPNYPLAAQRAELLRMRLAEMRDSLQYFEFGSRLMHFGRYREAIAFFREFQKQFPGRELFNNLGYCYLRSAVGQLDPDYAYRYWLPMVSDLETSMSKWTARSAEGADRRRMSAAAREGLLQSARYFELAIEKDGGYAPSFINLAVAHLLLGMESPDGRPAAVDGNHLLRAKLAVESALKLKPDDVQTKVLNAIVNSELQAADSSFRADASLQGVEAIVAAREPTLFYNLAEVARREPQKRDHYWRELTARSTLLPKKMQMLICRRSAPQTEGASCTNARNVSLASSKLPWTSPVKLSRDLLEAPITDGELKRNGWQKKDLKSGSAYVGVNSAVLATDEIVTLAVAKRSSGTADSLIECCGQPLEKSPIVNGSLWNYGRWIALVRDRSVDEIWLSN